MKSGLKLDVSALLILSGLYLIQYLLFPPALGGRKLSGDYLTASLFKSGPRTTPTKLWNPTIVGSGDPDSAQWPHSSSFYYWHSSVGNNGYLPFKVTAQIQNLFLWIFISCQPRLKKQLLQLGIHGDHSFKNKSAYVFKLSYRILKFVFSKKATKIDKLLTVDLTLFRKCRRWGVCQFLWPS